MQGASALQKILEDEGRAPVRLLLVWMPVLPTDAAPPTKQVLARARDPRITQHWDPDRALSGRLLEAARSGALSIPEAVGKSVMWDFVLAYPPGVTWGDSIPAPEYYGGPIVDGRVSAKVRERIRRAGS